MSHRIDALKGIAQRYWDVFRAAWAERNATRPVNRSADEAAFLPAHLELIETPVSPAPKWATRIIMGLFVAGLTWASLGKLDIVAVAPGKTVTDSRTKIIQSVETAVVQRILVKDGDRVSRGQLLVELDATVASADTAKARDALLDARATALRAAAVLSSLENSRQPELGRDAALPAMRWEAAKGLAESQYATYVAKARGLRASVAQREAELRTVDSAIAPLEQYLEISRTRVSDYESLLAKNYVPKQEYLLRKQERITAERDLVQQRNRQQELRSAILGARQELAMWESDIRRQYLDELRQAKEQMGQLEPELEKATQHTALMQLRSPADGTVQGLDIHTVGGVVTPAQPLMSVVPEEAVMEVEATVLNQDIGFIRPGQKAAIKIDSFPYTRYGFPEGVVESVSRDAIQDEKLGLVYKARVSMPKATMLIDGVNVRIGAGMSLVVEIKTGKRSVIDYILDPLHKNAGEAMRER
jgi:hemolysin D